ncbi:unnamed protein product, partial [Ceratitis capitata]
MELNTLRRILKSDPPSTSFEIPSNSRRTNIDSSTSLDEVICQTECTVNSARAIVELKAGIRVEIIAIPFDIFVKTIETPLKSVEPRLFLLHGFGSHVNGKT